MSLLLLLLLQARQPQLTTPARPTDRPTRRLGDVRLGPKTINR